jgi:hypothetical protein
MKYRLQGFTFQAQNYLPASGYLNLATPQGGAGSETWNLEPVTMCLYSHDMNLLN